MAAHDGPVLVVDDDRDVRDALRDSLLDEGYQAVVVASGHEALDYLRGNPAPPLVLVDWNMAPMNGPQFMAVIADDVALSQIPVVLLTADMRICEKVKSAGFVGHLMKPVDLDALFAIIRRYCG